MIFGFIQKKSMYGVIMTILIFTLLIAVVFIIWATPLTSVGDRIHAMRTESKLIHQIMTTDAQLHRLLLIETINTHPGIEATFERMQTGMHLIGSNLLSVVGRATSERLITLFQHRADIFREYYISIRPIPKLEPESDEFSIPEPLDPVPSPISELSIPRNLEPLENPRTLRDSSELDFPVSPRANSIPIQSLPVQTTGAILDGPEMDISESILQRLDRTNREIVDNISAAFHLKSNPDIPNKNLDRPFFHYDHLYTLFKMYDRELIQHGRLYADQAFTASLNSHTGVNQIALQLAREFQQILQTPTKKTSISAIGDL